MDGLVQMAKRLNDQDLVKRGRRGRDLHQLFVPSRVANDDNLELKGFQERYETQLRPFFSPLLTFGRSTFIDLKLPYVATFSYRERVTGRRQHAADEAELLPAYERLAEHMARLAAAESELYTSVLLRTRPARRTRCRCAIQCGARD